MSNQRGFNSTLVLVIVFVVVVVIIGGAVYLDSTGGLGKLIKNDSVEDTSAEVTDQTVAAEQQVQFVPYQSPDQLYQLQLPDFWVSEERTGVAIFYSYNPAEGEPEQRAKIEIGRVANTDQLTAAAWLAEQEIDTTDAQQAIFGTVAGLMLLQDNTEVNPGDIKSVIYMPVNDEMLIVTAESFGGSRDVAVQFFNAILNSWQWTVEVTSPDMIAGQEAVLVEPETVAPESIEEENQAGGEEELTLEEQVINEDEEVVPEASAPVDETELTPEDQPLE